ncbi:hypothetical protein AVEN_275161-1, partial [Araneus ventricosus]
WHQPPPVKNIQQLQVQKYTISGQGISLDIQGALEHLRCRSICNSLDEMNFPSQTTETLEDILNDRKVTSKRSKAHSAGHDNKNSHRVPAQIL